MVKKAVVQSTAFFVLNGWHGRDVAGFVIY